MEPDKPQSEQTGSQTDDTSGDYSYDLVHDLGSVPNQHRATEKAWSAAHEPDEDAAPGLDGDYSYDLAHEVPRARE